MKKRVEALLVAALLAAGVIAASPPSALSQAVQLVVVDVQAVAQGYRVSKLMGSPVVNDHKDRIGTIDDFVVDRDRVLFAILQVGGFLGIGGRLVAVPYKSIVLDDPSGKIILPGASREELKKLPEFQYRT
jgi:sporulation protein YlmC with PRC-barrel domain